MYNINDLLKDRKRLLEIFIDFEDFLEKEAMKTGIGKDDIQKMIKEALM